MTTDLYRILRSRGMGAHRALSAARYDAAAAAAGVPHYLPVGEDTEVVVCGRPYVLTVAHDLHLNDHDWDCLGHYQTRPFTDWGHPAPIEWPAVALPEGGHPEDRSTWWGPQATYYDPGPYFEVDSALAAYRRAGLSRHAAWLKVRADLVTEGLHVRGGQAYVVSLSDDTDTETLGGVDVGTGPDWRADLWWTITDLAGWIEAAAADRRSAIVAERTELGRRYAHLPQLPVLAGVGA